MKKKFSTNWIGSRQPRKQRKYRANAPLHIKRKMISCNLSKELRKKYEKRSFPIRKGDIVKIMRGEFRKKTGKIESVNVKKLRIMIEGIFRTKKDGTKVSVYFNPSNLQIKELNLEDQKRKKALERKIVTEKENLKKSGSETTKIQIKTDTKSKSQFKRLPKQGEKQDASK